METKEMLQYIDHTLLKPVCTWDEIETLCKEALSYHTASVCIPPSYVKRAREAFGPELPICTVIGFPLGYNPAEVKVCEARTALRDGADELDMVINLGDVKNRDFEKVYEEILAVARHVGIGQVSPQEIDEINILEATRKAMREAAAQVPADVFLVDAVTKGGASAALVASIVHYGQYTIAELKDYMEKAGVPVRKV